MDLWDTLRGKSRLRPDRPAFLTPHGSNRSRELFDAAERLASELSKAGVGSGHVVAVALPNSAAFVVSLLAVWRLHCVAALVSPKYGPAEWRALFQGIPELAVLTGAGGTIRLGDAAGEDREWTSLQVTGETAALKTGRRSELPHRFQDETVLLKFTSGSTAVPKGIALSVANLVAEASNVSSTLEISPDTLIYAPVPLCHSYGFDVGVLPFLFSGAVLRSEEVFIPRRALSVLEGPVSLYLGIPAQYRFLLETASRDAPRLAPSIVSLSCTAPLPPRTITDFSEQFGIQICQHYGSSEAGAVANHIPHEVLRRPHVVGRAMNGVEIHILDEAGRSLPAGTEGQVAVASGVVAQGYVMGAPGGCSPFQNGLFLMGDRGVLDGDGFLEVRGRRDDLINVAGLKVSPLEVARAIEECPMVREVVVYGVRDENGTEVVEAMVTLSSAAGENEILEFAGKRLADYKVPRRLRIVEDLPRGPGGKVRIP